VAYYAIDGEVSTRVAVRPSVLATQGGDARWGMGLAKVVPGERHFSAIDSTTPYSDYRNRHP